MGRKALKSGAEAPVPTPRGGLHARTPTDTGVQTPRRRVARPAQRGTGTGMGCGPTRWRRRGRGGKVQAGNDDVISRNYASKPISRCHGDGGGKTQTQASPSSLQGFFFFPPLHKPGSLLKRLLTLRRFIALQTSPRLLMGKLRPGMRRAALPPQTSNPATSEHPCTPAQPPWARRKEKPRDFLLAGEVPKHPAPISESDPSR